jgi:hypothetical protein
MRPARRVSEFRAAEAVQFWRIPLDSAPDRDVINAQIPLGMISSSGGKLSG